MCHKERRECVYGEKKAISAMPCSVKFKGGFIHISYRVKYVRLYYFNYSTLLNVYELS